MVVFHSIYQIHFHMKFKFQNRHFSNLLTCKTLSNFVGIIFFCSFIGNPFLAAAQSDHTSIVRDGKLLRSELWQPFDAQSAKGDFFVSPKGNDSWSGTLEAPNATLTNGPFATITRAKLAVRELKSSVYQPKGKAIDARYTGTTYPFGRGKDIVVFIRNGFYQHNTYEIVCEQLFWNWILKILMYLILITKATKDEFFFYSMKIKIEMNW